MVGGQLLDQAELGVEHRKLVFHFGVAGGHHRQPFRLARRVVGAGDELVRFAGEDAGQQRDGAFARDRPRALEVRDRHRRDADPLRQLGLGVAVLDPQAPDPVAEPLLHRLSLTRVHDVEGAQWVGRHRGVRPVVLGAWLNDPTRSSPASPARTARYLAEFLLDKGYEVVGMARRSSDGTFERIAHIQDASPSSPATCSTRAR